MKIVLPAEIGRPPTVRISALVLRTGRDASENKEQLEPVPYLFQKRKKTTKKTISQRNHLRLDLNTHNTFRFRKENTSFVMNDVLRSSSFGYQMTGNNKNDKRRKIILPPKRLSEAISGKGCYNSFCLGFRMEGTGSNHDQ